MLPIRQRIEETDQRASNILEEMKKKKKQNNEKRNGTTILSSGKPFRRIAWTTRVDPSNHPLKDLLAPVSI